MSNPELRSGEGEPFDLEQAPLDRPRGFETDWGGDDSDRTRPVRAHVLAALPPSVSPYPLPLRALIALGDDDVDDLVAEHSIGQEHAPELVRMVRDRALVTAPTESPESWAPFHALHILERLDLSAHVNDLLPLFDTGLHELADELLWTLGTVGEAAIAPLLALMNDRTRWDMARSRAANALEVIARQFPAYRDEIVAAISALVQQAEEESEGLVSLAVASLVELKAVEALPVIRRAFELGKVDESVPGTWGSVLDDLGVEPDPDDPLIDESRRRAEERYARMFPGPSTRPQLITSPGRQAPAQKRSLDQARKEKHKRKAAKASRKANRKKRK